MYSDTSLFGQKTNRVKASMFRRDDKPETVLGFTFHANKPTNSVLEGSWEPTLDKINSYNKTKTNLVKMGFTQPHLTSTLAEDPTGFFPELLGMFDCIGGAPFFQQYIA